jgi:aquaporin Z
MSYRRYIAEFIGTFFLVLTICMVGYGKVSSDLQPLAVGTVLIAMIYACGHISAAHFNPAVTVAFFLRGKIDIKNAGFYILAQMLGGIAAALLTGVLISAKPPTTSLMLPPQYFSVIPAILSEVVGAFALVWVILNVATAKALEGNSFYGIAIGFTITALMYTLGNVSGSVFNPAVAVATCIVQFSSWNNLWIYMVGSIIGAVLGAIVFKYVNLEEA